MQREKRQGRELLETVCVREGERERERERESRAEQSRATAVCMKTIQGKIDLSVV